MKAGSLRSAAIDSLRSFKGLSSFEGLRLGAIDAKLVERFAADLARLSDENSTHTLGIAVSGGPDSLAALLLAHRAMPGRIEAATVDHQLREESAGEADCVARLCEELGVPHTILTVQVAKGNLQAEARAARYSALAEWSKARKVSAILTAHHADDQAETLMMRLNRGSGLSGLAGVRAKGAMPVVRAKGTMPDNSVPVLRPLLDWRKTELEAVCKAAGVTPLRDPSNQNMDFDRARIRKVLGQSDWIDPLALSQSASLLAEADDLVRALTEAEFAGGKAAAVDGGFVYTPNAHRLIAVEVVQRILAQMEARPRKSEIARAVDRLFAGENASLAGVLARQISGPDKEVQWRFELEPPRRAPRRLGSNQA